MSNLTVSQVLVDMMPLLIMMLLLLGFSAFFSASEAALFSLRLADRSALKKGTHVQRLTDQLLDDPDRLLSGVLFWNLVVYVGTIMGASPPPTPNPQQPYKIHRDSGWLQKIVPG